jgi:hypothetical protein
VAFSVSWQETASLGLYRQLFVQVSRHCKPFIVDMRLHVLSLMPTSATACNRLPYASFRRRFFHPLWFHNNMAKSICYCGGSRIGAYLFTSYKSPYLVAVFARLAHHSLARCVQLRGAYTTQRCCHTLCSQECGGQRAHRHATGILDLSLRARDLVSPFRHL